MMWRWLAVLVAVVGAGCGGQEGPQVSYASQVQPIFDKYCVACHSPDGLGYRKTGLRLDSYEELSRGKVLTPGSPSNSKIVIYIHGTADPYTSMPFGSRSHLKKSEIALITDWIDQGARNN